MKFKFCAATLFALCVATSANAERVIEPSSSPTVGVNLSWIFGAGPAVGVRVLSTDKKDNDAFTIGFDYMLYSQNLRGALGVAYLGKDSFTEGNIGYEFTTGNVNFGLGLGLTQTTAPATSGDVWQGD